MPNHCTCRHPFTVLCPRCSQYAHLEERGLATMAPPGPHPPAYVAYASPYVDRHPHVVAQDCHREDGAYVVFIDRLRTRTETNTGGHWWNKAHAAKLQRSMAFYILRDKLGLRCPLVFPLMITLTRVAPSIGLDEHENLPSAMKHVVDGISDYLAGEYGKGQDRQEGLRWLYAQRRGAPRQYAVEIRIEQGEPL